MNTTVKAFILKNSLVLGIAAVVVVGGGIYWYIASSAAPAFGSVSATRGNVIASVDEPAAVQAENSVDLSFQASGQIASVNVKEGDVVGVGQTLTALDQSSLAAGVQQANAALAAAQAKLDSLMNGTRPEQLQINQSAVTNARASLSASIGSAYTASDDAVRNQIDNFFMNPRSSNPVLLITVGDSQLVTDIQNRRVTLGGTLDAWYAALNASNADPVALSTTADNALKQVKAYLDEVAIAVNTATPNGAITATILAGYKVNVVTARTEVVAAISGLTTAESTYATAQSQLVLAQAGSTVQDIEVQKAAVLQAQAAATTANVALEHASIRAPFSGIVRNLTAKIGQIATPGVPVVSLTNTDGLKVIAYVSEGDIAKIKAGDAANITLDAYGTGTVFKGTVTTIDTAQSQVNGTPAYKVTLHFSAPDSGIKDGMTGNAHIIADEHDNVIEVPSRLIVNDGSDHFLLVAGGNGNERRAVQVGLSGDDGMTEITSGIDAGEHVINF